MRALGHSLLLTGYYNRHRHARHTAHHHTHTCARFGGRRTQTGARQKREREKERSSEREKLIFLFIKKNQNISAWFTSSFFFDYFIFVAANWQRNIIYVLFMIAGFSFNFHSHGDFRLAAVLFRPKETCLIYLT